MKLDINSLLTEYLLGEYNEDEINRMLSKATTTIKDNQIIVKYNNGVTETLSINIKLFLTQESIIIP